MLQKITIKIMIIYTFDSLTLATADIATSIYWFTWHYESFEVIHVLNH